MQDSLKSPTLERAPRWGEANVLEAVTANVRVRADVVIAIVLSALAALLFLRYDMLEQPFPPDTTFHVYAGQQILQGHAIYRDVGIIKAPLADFIAAFSI